MVPKIRGIGGTPPTHLPLEVGGMYLKTPSWYPTLLSKANWESKLLVSEFGPFLVRAPKGEHFSWQLRQGQPTRRTCLCVCVCAFILFFFPEAKQKLVGQLGW